MNDLSIQEDTVEGKARIKKYFNNIGQHPGPSEIWDWCAAAVCTWLKEGSSPIQPNTACCKTLSSLIGGRFIKPFSFKKNEEKYFTPGNIIFFRRGASDLGHVGILEKFDPVQKKVVTIDGNSGTDANKVARMSRDLETVTGIGLVSDPV